MKQKNDGLCPDELRRIAEACVKIELTEYKQGGWKYLSGGFANCNMVDYDDECIYLEMTSGCQSDCDDRVYTDKITLDRNTMEERGEL